LKSSELLRSGLIKDYFFKTDFSLHYLAFTIYKIPNLQHFLQTLLFQIVDMTHAKIFKVIGSNSNEVKDMVERSGIREGKIGREIGLDKEDIELLYSLTPENFSEFRDKFNAQLQNEQRVIFFCA